MKRAIPFAHLTVFFVLLLLTAALARENDSALPQNAFIPDCPPPFPAASPRPVDVSCANEGTFTDNATDEHRAQNRAKNSFCARGSNGNVATDPIVTTVAIFDTLQTKVVNAGIQFGSSANLPQDRNALKNIATDAAGISIGEGSYVVFVGFMLDAHSFFDGSHRPCGDPNMSSRDPIRRSSWEIHPVYSIDVCSNTTLSGCKYDDETVWTTFDDWIVSQ